MPKSAQRSQEPRGLKMNQSLLGLDATGKELERLFVRIPGQRSEAESFLASADLEPDDSLRRIKRERLLGEFQGHSELLVKKLYARGEPMQEPIIRREEMGFLEAVLGAL